MSKILLVRLSSMGDIINAMPAVTDMAQAMPGLKLDWVVEDSFQTLPRLHPAVDRIIPVALRRWRKSPLSGTSWREFCAARSALAQTPYDMILDVQGLLKSVFFARMARGPIAGPDRHSAREGLAALAYQKSYPIVWHQHAIQRVRKLAAQAFDYPLPVSINYGLTRPEITLSWLPASPYVVLLTATSRPEKEWPESRWISLGQRFAAQGLACVLPWGNAQEQARAERIAQGIPQAIVAPKMALDAAATLLADARVVVGVDTGLAHLAAAMATPVVAVFLASDPVENGVLASTYAVNVGHNGASPEVDEVWQAAAAGMRA
ncbi:lipopolysaccharide heptosyltransferase I [Silvimonas iriomotensis]|uniref:Lipopolysaccharide heptosyltransferase 1 n=1 Tax=Silvimonas iriomotensis TaxID=449662 RepID=A0ABQ2PCV3_9NEIS|nr:lipopolysaccharide heptosyltransferase I [Silvimonas iriomotensis]GGP23039.1 heptosyltransferase I [Silvimonas iriomotensis]